MFFKRKVTLNLYTDRPDIYHWSQLQEAKKHKPEWWRRLKSPDPDGLELNPTMRHCRGFNNLFAKSFFAPMWCEALGNIYPDGQWDFTFADNNLSRAEEHNEAQRGEFMPHAEYQHIKFMSPWYAHCDENIDFLYTNADYFDESNKDLIVLNGVNNFKHQGALHLNVMIKRSLERKTIFIKKDTPMYMLIPLTERKVVLKHHLVTSVELLRIKSKKMPILHFTKNYRKVLSCPFHAK